jgi:hypothetical protein
MSVGHEIIFEEDKLIAVAGNCAQYSGDLGGVL